MVGGICGGWVGMQRCNAVEVLGKVGKWGRV